MARLSGSVRLGTGSASSLIKSAQTVANQMLTLQTNIADQAWNDSAKTADDYKTYTSTVSGLLDKAKGNTTPTGLDRVITLQNKLTSAGTAYNSAQIKRAQINILQGTGTQADKVNLLAQLYTQASDPADQQSILMQYDSAVKTLNDQNAAAYNKAVSTAQSNLQKSYTGNNTKFTTFVAQVAASIKTGTNQIDPTFLHGQTTVYLNPDGTISADQTKAQAGSKPVNLTVPAPGKPMNAIDLFHFYGMAKMGQYVNEVAASSDPGLTADQQATHASQASTMFNDLQSSIYTNAKIATAEAEGQPALVRKAINGTAELVENPNVSPAGKYVLNPSAQTLQAALAAQKKTGSNQGVAFNMMKDGIPTTYSLRNLGNAVIANDPFAVNDLQATTYLYDSKAGKLVPFNSAHQAQFNEARSISNPAQAQAAELAVVNNVASGYQKGQQPAQKPGLVGNVENAAGKLVSNIDTLGKNFFGVGAKTVAPKVSSPTHDPLGRLGSGLVGAIGKAVPELGVIGDVTHFLGHLVGGAKPMAVSGPATHPNVPLPGASAYTGRFGGGPDQLNASVAAMNAATTRAQQAAAVTAQANFDVNKAPVTGNSARDVGNLVGGLTGGAIPGPGL